MVRLLSDLRILGNAVRFYFPALFFVGFAALAFFYITEARDMMAILAETAHGPLFLFISVFCWAFITWYTSYIVVYTRCQLLGDTGGFPLLYRWFPRLLAVACYAIPSFAMLSLSYVHMDVLTYYGLMLFYIALVLIITTLFWRRRSGSKYPRPFWWATLVAQLMLMTLSGTFFIYEFRINLMISSLSLLVFSIIHLLFMVQHFPRASDRGLQVTWPQQPWLGFLRLELPRWQLPYLQVLNAISVVLVVIYVLGMYNLNVARYLGPFSIPFLAFTLFLGLGNLVTFIGLRIGLRLHLSIGLFALICGSLTEPHWTRMIKGDRPLFHQRATTKAYFDAFFEQNYTSTGPMTLVFILADGGASRSGLWTSAMLSELHEVYGVGFRNRLFSLSGVSGGAVGVSAYYAMLSQTTTKPKKRYPYRTNAEAFFSHDFLSFTLMRMIGPDLLRYFAANHRSFDRAGYLELGMELSTDRNSVSHAFQRPFSEITREFNQALNGSRPLPILFLNAARMRDGSPAVISNIRIGLGFNNRIDLLDLVDSSAIHYGYNDLRLSTAAVLCSRFPYISPAGRINDSYFIDGGYFDNSGAGVTHELMLTLDEYLMKKDTTGKLYERVNYVVIHLQNTADPTPKQGKIHPAVNDLMAPIVGITQVRTMQTRVNNERLKRYLKTRYPEDLEVHWINYNLIDEYEKEMRHALGPKLMEDYSMNWVLSDSIQRRMQREVDVRFQEHRKETDKLFRRKR